MRQVLVGGRGTQRLRPLHEGRQHEPVPGTADGPRQCFVLVRRRARTEIDVDDDLLRTEIQEALDQLSMVPPRPRPGIELVQALGIDLDEHQPAARRPLGNLVAELHELPLDGLQSAERVGQQRQRPRREVTRARAFDRCG